MDKILIIEDDVEINTLLTDFLKENGYVVYSQYDGLHVLDFLHKEKIDRSYFQSVYAVSVIPQFLIFPIRKACRLSEMQVP